MAATLPFRGALNKGIVSGTLVDTKIILFSRRDSSGKVCGPKALYASSHVLKSVPYFNDLLFGNFSEAELKDFNDDTGNEEFSAEDYGYYSDSDLEDDEDENPNQPARSRDEPRAAPSRQRHRSVDEKSYHENRAELANKGKVVRVPDIAFVTFQAFIFYLYTGQIEFASHEVQDNRNPKTTEVQAPLHDNITRPSSKSIYRLADKYDAPALKNLALNHIRGGLKNCDIVEETFSEFTSRYEEIKMACIPHLVSALRNDTAEKTTWTRLCEIIESHFKGDLQHVTDTLSSLWRTVNGEGDPTTAAKSSDLPSTASTCVNNPESCADLHTAIAKSIREGVFFDRKYWAQYSKKGNALKAVYFSSAFMDSELEACTIYSNGKTSLVKDTMGEMDAESDCESDSAETDGDAEETRAVLSPGSHSAWRSLFFYKFTGHFSFAPLKSQGSDYRLKYIFKNVTAGTPPPCSPKSIYTLAKLLSIQPLRELAFRDIESKLSERNIVNEFFSHFSASDRNVLEMECRLLFSKFKNEATMSLVQEKIGGTFGNNVAYRAEAFKLGLRTALNLEERGPAAEMIGAVMLRCRSLECRGHGEFIPSSLTGTSYWLCMLCKANRMQCSGCGHVRRRRDTNACCESCRKIFL